jgi:hypothetical protein
MMDNLYLVIPFLVVVCGLLITTAYILCMAVRDMAKQLARTNELLLLAWRSGEGDGFAARALVARAAGLASAERKAPGPPKKLDKLKGVAEEKQGGMTVKMGAL